MLLPGGVLLALAACPTASTPKSTPSQSRPAVSPTAAPPMPTPEPPPPAAAVPAQPAAVSASPRPYLAILKLQQSGASQEELLQKVQAENVRFDLTTAEILELRQAGVSETVVGAMLRSGR
jgi:hypothetical protein